MAQSDSHKLFFEVLDIVKTEFETKDGYLEEGVPTFIIDATPPLQEKIEKLRIKLQQLGLDLVIRSSETVITLRVFPRATTPSPPKRVFGLSWPLILFIATLISVAISGYLTSASYLEVLRILGRIEPDEEFTFLLRQTVFYTLAIMCIVGLHELGHLIAHRLNRIPTSLPIFIPGIPGLTPGTFGAVIIQEGPALNRDQLFDIGFAGPFVGFIISLIVSGLGYSLSLPITRAEYQLITSIIGPPQLVYLPLIFNFFEPYILNVNSFTYFLHPLAEAGWMGTVITFLNAFPIGQLDGGHVARATLSPRQTKTLAYLMTGVMFLAGWWTMALFAIFFIRFQHPGTLDDVTPLSRNKKILALVFVAMFFACFTISPDSLFTLFF